MTKKYHKGYQKSKQSCTVPSIMQKISTGPSTGWQARRTANPCPCFPVVDVSILPPQRMPYCFASERGGAGRAAQPFSQSFSLSAFVHTRQHNTVQIRCESRGCRRPHGTCDLMNICYGLDSEDVRLRNWRNAVPQPMSVIVLPRTA